VSEDLSYLFRLEQFGIKFGLENIRTLLDHLGSPERAFPSIHIAGTNGKGSVTAMIDTALREAGYRSARYTSPHLVDLSERFVVDGQPADAHAVRDVAQLVRRTIDALLSSGTLTAPPTFFEATTAMAFELFRRADAEIAVVEVGLGGRLDSTNVITPVVSAITSIDFDHQQYLGTTLREIAFEKAGIIKPGVPVVVGPVGDEAFEVIAGVARERAAELIRAMDGTVVRGRCHFETARHQYGDIRLALRGQHQVVNAVVAIRVLETLDARGVSVPAAAIARGLERVSWPGRLEHRALADGRELIMDAAHNPAGAAALAAYLAELGEEKRPLVFAAMRDKASSQMLEALLPHVGPLIVTRASNLRSADPQTLAEQARALAPARTIQTAVSVADALRQAWSLSPRIVVAGSIFLLGDVLREIDA